MKKIKLSTWAKLNDVNYKTAHKWIKDGNFPEKYEYTPSGSIFVLVEEDKNNVDKLLKNVKELCILLYGEEEGNKKTKFIITQILK